MLKKTISYDDLDGNSITEDFYFNLSKAEIAEMELSQKGGLSDYLKHIVATDDSKAIISTFKEILMKSIGQRSEDGKRFVKSDDISVGFTQTDAYSVLFMELLTKPDDIAAFIRGIVPADIGDKIDVSELSELSVTDVALPSEHPKLSSVKSDVVVSQPVKQDVVELSREDLEARLAELKTKDENKQGGEQLQ